MRPALGRRCRGRSCGRRVPTPPRASVGRPSFEVRPSPPLAEPGDEPSPWTGPGAGCSSFFRNPEGRGSRAGSKGCLGPRRMQDSFTLTAARPGNNARGSFRERRVFGTRGPRPQMGRQDRHGSMRARHERPQDAPSPGSLRPGRTPLPGPPPLRSDRTGFPLHPHGPIPQRETPPQADAGEEEVASALPERR